MAQKIDWDRLDISTYHNEKEDNFSWWFQWCQDEDPLTFWERRYEQRKNRQNQTGKK